MRFSQAAKAEATTPDPLGRFVLAMREKLRRFVQNLRRKKGWYPDLSVVSWAEVEEEDEDKIMMEIATIIACLRKKKMTSRVTEKAAHRVIDAVRLWVLRRRAEKKKLEFLPQEEIDKLSSTPLFSQVVEDTVEEFEDMYEAEFIDLVDYYLLLAAYKGEPIVEAARVIEMKPETARSALSQARKKARAFLEVADTKQPRPPRSAVGRPRQDLDNNLLMHAINYMTGRGRSLR